VLRLLDAQAAALAAARTWDGYAYDIAKAEWSVRETVMEQSGGYRAAAEAIGVDASRWEVGLLDDYESSWRPAHSSAASPKPSRRSAPASVRSRSWSVTPT
jgi:hypothetical protein